MREINVCMFVIVAPRIDRNAMVDIKVRAGHNFELDVPVIGEPPPLKDWSLKGNTVLNSDRIKVCLQTILILQKYLLELC